MTPKHQITLVYVPEQAGLASQTWSEFISSRLMMEALTVVISKKESFSSYQKTRSNELKIRFDLNLILLTVSWVMKSWKFYIRIAFYDVIILLKILDHGVWKSQKKSHSTLRAKRGTFTFCVDECSLKSAKNGPFWWVFENLKLAVKQCY